MTTANPIVSELSDRLSQITAPYADDLVLSLDACIVILTDPLATIAAKITAIEAHKNALVEHLASRTVEADQLHTAIVTLADEATANAADYRTRSGE